MKTSITKRFGPYPFSHRQPKHDGHCALIHGHNWSFDITFDSTLRDENGFILDFGKMGELKEHFKALFDHTFLVQENDPAKDRLMQLHVEKLAKVTLCKSGSAEALAEWVYEIAEQWVFHEEDCVKRNVDIVRVTVWEDEKNSATYER
jgi:6-pyruvoyltetrahydropterin/6-carboxytetrahydropterin synthase